MPATGQVWHADEDTYYISGCGNITHKLTKYIQGVGGEGAGELRGEGWWGQAGY